MSLTAFLQKREGGEIGLTLRQRIPQRRVSLEREKEKERREMIWMAHVPDVHYNTISKSKMMDSFQTAYEQFVNVGRGWSRLMLHGPRRL